MQIDVVFDDSITAPDFTKPWEGWDPEYQNRAVVKFEERLLSESGRNNVIELCRRVLQKCSESRIDIAELTPVRVSIYPELSSGTFKLHFGTSRPLSYVLPILFLDDIDATCDFLVDFLSRRKSLS